MTECIQKLSLGLHHRAVLQYDKHSDELSLELVFDPVVDALKETKHLLKTEFPEIRKT